MENVIKKPNLYNMKSKIIFEKTYYLPTFLGGLRKGWLITRTFIISKTPKRMFLRQEIDVIEFRGRDELMRAIKGKKELPQEADGNRQYIPQEIKKLLIRKRKIPLKIEL